MITAQDSDRRSGCQDGFQLHHPQGTVGAVGPEVVVLAVVRPAHGAAGAGARLPEVAGAALAAAV